MSSLLGREINLKQSGVQEVIFRRLAVSSLHVLQFLGLWIFETRWINADLSESNV